MTRRRGAEAVADAQQQRAERLGLPLGDAARRLVEQHAPSGGGRDAGEVDDPAGAGRQLAHELAPEGAEAEQLDQLVDPLGAPAPRCRTTAGQVERGVERVADVDPALERDGDGLLDGERREQAGVLERPAEPAPGPARAPSGGDVVAAEARRGRRRRR